MIRLDDICSGYGKKKVIYSISACLERGELTVIIGPNGCGKSTLLKCISGMLPPMSGKLFVDGKELSGMKREDVAKCIAYLAQGRDVPDMTVGQLVLHGRFPHLSYPRCYGKADREIALGAMKRMGVGHLSDEPLKSLSGGVRQSAYIAMALAQGTDCILFDEPAVYLDISHTLSLMRQMKELAGDGHAVAAVMHDIPMAFSFADKVIVMRNGRIVTVGAPDDICSSGVIETVFGVGVEKDGRRYNYKNF